MPDLIYTTNYSTVPATYFDKAPIVPLKRHHAKNPTLSFFTSSSTPMGGKGAAFQDGEYDLYETGRIIDTESLVARAFNKKNTLIFRDGFTIKSDNDENLEYIKRRLREIQYVSEATLNELLVEYSYNLVSYHNPYLVKVRKKSASSGQDRKLRGRKRVHPVAAYFCLAPETMQKRLNDAGDAEVYRQYLSGGRYKEFAAHNVVYSPYNKRTGFTMGTPPLEAVREDILALRRIEESVETLIYKSLFPIIHVKVGTDKVPAKSLPSGVTEVDASTQLLENIDDNGGIVTSERISISSIGAESIALRVESYLEHFKKRVFAGLGMSAIDFGDGDCYDEKTETLTTRGWKFPSEINEDDGIATYNPGTGRVEFHVMNSAFHEAYSGPMIRIKGSNVDIKVTPTHTMYINPINEDGGEQGWQRLTAESLLDLRYDSLQIMTSAPYTQSSPRSETIVIEGHPDAKHSGSPISCLEKDFAEVLGHIVSYGRVREVDIFHEIYSVALRDVPDAKLDGIVELLDRTGMRNACYHAETPGLNVVNIYGAALYHYVVRLMLTETNIIGLPREAFEFSELSRGALLDSVIGGLGHHIEPYISERSTLGSRGYARCYSQDETLLGQVQELVGSLGRECKLVKVLRDPEDQYRYADTIHIGEVVKHPHAIVTPDMVKKIHYTGVVYCYNIPNHLFLTRRNGATTIQGNTTGRATGEVLSASLRDSVVTYQELLAEMVTTEIFTELLLESGRYTHAFEIPEEEQVRLEFNTVDTAEAIKKESHTLNKMDHGILLTNEARRELGLTPLSEADLENLHTVAMARVSMKQTAEFAPTKETETESPTEKPDKKDTSKDKNKKQKAAAKTTKSITNPKNQHSDSVEALSKYIDTVSSVDIVSRKLIRSFSDIAMLSFSEGIMDGKEFVPEEIRHLVTHCVESCLEGLADNTNGLTGIRRIVNKTIDKLLTSVNNIPN